MLPCNTQCAWSSMLWTLDFKHIVPPLMQWKFLTTLYYFVSIYYAHVALHLLRNGQWGYAAIGTPCLLQCAWQNLHMGWWLSLFHATIAVFRTCNDTCWTLILPCTHAHCLSTFQSTVQKCNLRFLDPFIVTFVVISWRVVDACKLHFPITFMNPFAHSIHESFSLHVHMCMCGWFSTID